jgi:hypothetical protein
MARFVRYVTIKLWTTTQLLLLMEQLRELRRLLHLQLLLLMTQLLLLNKHSLTKTKPASGGFCGASKKPRQSAWS